MPDQACDQEAWSIKREASGTTLLCGGDKERQQRDIERARLTLAELDKG
jgi:putative component of toxin-antitoxin plasmid stabilization module